MAATVTLILDISCLAEIMFSSEPDLIMETQDEESTQGGGWRNKKNEIFISICASPDLGAKQFLYPCRILKNLTDNFFLISTVKFF